MITLSDVYISAGQTRAIGPFNVALTPGRWVGLVGPSGCGKSLLLRVLAGITLPVRGKRMIVAPTEGREAPPAKNAAELSAEEQRVIARVVRYVPQDEPFDVEEDVAEVLRMRAQLRGYSGDKLKQVLNESIAQWWLDKIADRPLWKLARPVRRRVALAEAFLGKPRVVLIDDPFWGSEDNQTRLLRDTMLEQKARPDLCAVCASRVGQELMGLVDDILELTAEGRVRYFGPAAEWEQTRAGLMRFRLTVKGPGGEIRRLIGRVDGIEEVLWHEGGIYNTYEVRGTRDPLMRERIFRAMAKRSYPIIELASDDGAHIEDHDFRDAATRRATGSEGALQSTRAGGSTAQPSAPASVAPMSTGAGVEGARRVAASGNTIVKRAPKPPGAGGAGDANGGLGASPDPKPSPLLTPSEAPTPAPLLARPGSSPAEAPYRTEESARRRLRMRDIDMDDGDYHVDDAGRLDDDDEPDEEDGEFTAPGGLSAMAQRRAGNDGRADMPTTVRVERDEDDIPEIEID